MKTITRILMLCIGLLGYNAVNAQLGCTDSSACNYDELASEDDGSCDYSCLGCTDELAENYDPEVTIDDGSCFYALCLPVDLTIEENCIWDSFSGEFITRVIITPTITGVCFLEEICYQEVGGGIQGCVDLPATGQYIQSGESVIIPLLGAGVYEFTASTAQGTSDPVDVAVNCYDNQSVCGNPYAVNYDPDAEKSYELACIYDNYICDCAGTQHNIGVLLWLGDGFYEEGTGTSIWYGQPVDFSCNLWGWDCGDGGIFHDPYETCEGELPPNNGCAAPACSPLAMTFSQAECTYSDSTGYKPAFYAHFSMNGDCDIEEFTYRESSTSPWVTIPILDAGLNLTSGDSLLITDTKAEYIYQCYYSSSSGSVSPYFYFSNGTCTNENTFCDCDQNVWDSDALDLLGNGEDNVGYEGEGIGVNFNCLTWAYDCGDLGIEGDPIGVCEGILPPENGCISLIFGCSEEGACNYNENVNFDDGSCDFESCLGCTDPDACNFASTATQDDGSCDFESCLGCPDPSACN